MTTELLAVPHVGAPHVGASHAGRAAEAGRAPASVPLDLAPPVLGSLSPSRAGDFMTCPLLFRYRTIDRLPSTPTPAATRGTVVHAVLERLYDLPALERTLEAAASLVQPEWERLLEAEPACGELFDDEAALTAWLGSARDLLAGYFSLEDPTRLEPAERERLVEVVLPGGLRLRGIVDRLDEAPTGELRVVDYKGLAVDTPLPTPTGWTTMADVEVGAELIGSDGRPCRVTVKSQVHRRPCYEVRFTDGTIVVCDNVHLWSVHVPHSADDGWDERVLDTDALYRLESERPSGARARRRPFVRATRPLELPEAELPIDPWLLGAWLGDGATRNAVITVGHADRADMLTLLKQHWPGTVDVAAWSERSVALAVSLGRPRKDLCPYGHDAWRMVERAGRAPYRRCAKEWDHSSLSRWNASLSELLSRNGLSGRKHVPAAYLRASRAQRLALLQGLMDTDGHWSVRRGRAVLVTTTPDLARAARELVQSLGGSASLFTKGYTTQRGDRTVHRVEFRPTGFNPFQLPRKAVLVDEWCAQRPARQGVPSEQRRTIASITPVPSVPTQCVKVDAADALYLCGQGLVPTHNTGRAPGEMFEGKALFQMKFYALVLWRTRGVVPSLLQLMYLGDREVLRYSPDEADLLAVERKLLALWAAIETATARREFLPRPSKLCGWCDHQALCPSFGGTPPPFPEVVPGPGEPLPHQRAAVEAQRARQASST